MTDSYGERVRQCMKEHGMDIDSLSAEAWLPQTVVKDVLSGKVGSPEPFVRERLATVLRAPALVVLDASRSLPAATKAEQTVYESAANFNRFIEAYAVPWEYQQDLWRYGMKGTDLEFQLRAVALKIPDWTELYRRRFKRDAAASPTLFHTELWQCTGCGFQALRPLPRCPECNLSEDDATPFERVR